MQTESGDDATRERETEAHKAWGGWRLERNPGKGPHALNGRTRGTQPPRAANSTLPKAGPEAGPLQRSPHPGILRYGISASRKQRWSQPRMPATKLIAVNASSAGGHLPLPSVLSAAIRCADLTCAIKLLLRGASPVGCTPRTPASRGEWGAALSQSCAESAPASPQQGSSAPHQPSFAGPRANQATRTRGARRRSLTPVVLVPRLAQPTTGVRSRRHAPRPVR